jgi:hypothetical protein
VTRLDSVRAATGTAKENVRHAADLVAPYAGTAKDQAARYAHEARVRLTPVVSQAAQQARDTALIQYDAYVQPRLQQSLQQARGALPPKVDVAARKTAKRARKAAHKAADYTVPRVEHAMAAAEPVREEAVQRGAAAIAALRGQVTPAEIEKLLKKRRRRSACGRGVKRFLMAGMLAGAAMAAWKWWDRQTNPDWLVEPPEPTEAGGLLTSVDGSEQTPLDPETEAKQAEQAEQQERGEQP